MVYNTESEEATRKKGRFAAIVVCWCLGNGSFISWNSMLTIVDYNTQVFPSYHPIRVFTLIYQIFAFVTSAILTYHEAKLNTRIRSIFGYTLFFISSFLIIVLDLATSGKGGVGTFIGICLICAAFGVADATVQGGMIGDLALMQPEFIQSFLAGLAASGALTSALRLIMKAVFEHKHDGLRKGAMIFFAISSFLELLCVLLYAYVFPKLPIVKYYRSKAASEGSKTVSADLAAAGIHLQYKQEVEEDPKPKERLTIMQLLMQNLDYALGLYLIFILTLSIFPGFLSEDTGNHALGSWYVLVLIAMYNALDLIGRYTPLIKCLHIESRKGLMIAILSRFLFIPAFYFTAKYGRQGWIIMLTSLLGLTNGHLTVCVLTEAPKGYKGPEANALGNLLVMFVLGGVSSGVAVDWLWLIGKVIPLFSRRNSPRFSCKLMGKRLFSGDVSPLPDNLRCRRSDGRQWRCPQPAKYGLSFCEYHYQQVRRNQDNIKSTTVAVAAAEAESEGRLLFTADPPVSRKKRRRRMRKDPSAAEPVLSEKMEEGDVERESSDLKSNRDLSLPVKFWHQQFDSRDWQCSQSSMPVLNFCDRRHLRCKQPNEKNNKVIEPMPKRSPRLDADLMPSIKRRGRLRLKRETRAEEPVKISEREEGACDMDTADPPVTSCLRIPDKLRCRRSDGRKWRCTQPAIPGLSFCEHHQMRCKQTYSKNTRAKVAKSEWRFQFSVDPRRSTKRRHRRRMGEQPEDDLMRMEQNEDLKAAELATPELNLYDKDLLCCKEDSSKYDEVDQREEEVEAAEPFTQEEMEAAEPAMPGLNVSANDQQCCKEDNNRNKDVAIKPSCMLPFAGDPQPSMKDLSLPDHLRCRRSDGRKWRCPQLSMPSVGFCEYHYLQVRRNQGKRKNTRLSSVTKRKRGLRLATNQSLAKKLRRHRLKGELLGEESMRTKQDGDVAMEATNLEVTRDLPNGVMAISPASVKAPVNASPWLHWKIGSDDGYLFGRRFRSKNAELVPLGKKLPFSRNMIGRRKKVCHRCRAKKNKVECMIHCLNCHECFCTTCIATWHSEFSELEIKMSCPVCRGCCTCTNCDSRRDEDGGSKKLVIHQNKFSTSRHDQHLICDLIPLVKHINGEQITELEIEANSQGKKLLDAGVEVEKYSDDEQVNCNNCRTKINYFYRNCSTCTYRFCLTCCQKIRIGSFTKGDGTAVCKYSKRHAYCRVDKAFYGKKVGISSKKHVNVSALCTSVLPDWTTNKDGSISCPPKELGGCGVGILNINFANMSSSAKFISE